MTKINFYAYPNDKKFKEHNFVVISIETESIDYEKSVDKFLKAVENKKNIPELIKFKTWSLGKWTFKNKLTKTLIKSNKAAEILFDDPDDVQIILKFMKNSYVSKDYNYIVYDDVVEVYPENIKDSKYLEKFRILFQKTPYEKYFLYIVYCIAGIYMLGAVFIGSALSLFLAGMARDSGEPIFVKDSNKDVMITFIVMLISLGILTVTSPIWVPIGILYNAFSK